MKRQKKKDFDLAFSIEEDALIKELIDATGKRVEIVAFGIIYTGTLKKVDPDNGFILLVDGEDKAMLEIERIESFALLKA